MTKTYKLITEKDPKKMEDAVNTAVSQGWELEEFNFSGLALAKFWALMVREKEEEIESMIA